MKRDYIQEILSKKERADNNERDSILIFRQESMIAVVEHCKKHIDVQGLESSSYFTQQTEIHRYIPIGIIAYVESYFRAVVKELIDFGLPFSENAGNFNKTKDIKFDFDIVQAIQGKKLTIGDFISHLLPLKSFQDINSTIGVLIGKDFLKELKPYFFINKDYYFERDNENYMPLNESLTDEQLTEISQIYEGVQETFRLRNIFCHEAAESKIIVIENIYKSFEQTVRFLEATNEFIWDLIEPNRPLTKYDLSVKLSEDLERLNNELENLIKNYALEAIDFKTEIIEIHNAWKNYREKKSDLVGEEWKGGSGQGIAVMTEEISLTEIRIAELKEEIETRRYIYGQPD